MKKISLIIAGIICFITVSFILTNKTILAQEVTSMKSNNISLKDYDIHFFGSATGSTPHSVIQLDNNGEILLACQLGKTIEQLKADSIEVTQSQIRLLQDWRLILKEDKILKTNFPILGSSENVYLRSTTKDVAERIGPELKEEVDALKKILKSEGYEKNTYTILFSYVLDKLVWNELEEARRIIVERKISGKLPFWAGFLWAMYPPRKFSCGTNHSTDQGVGLYLNWSETGGKLIFSFYSDPEAYKYLLDDIIQYGKVKNKKALAVFKPYNIFDYNGNLTIPVVVEDISDSLYKLCKLIAQKVAEQVENTLDTQDIGNELAIKDRGEIIVVAYHELMWDLIDYFVSQGTTQKPVVFVNPERAELSDISDLIFIVKETEDR